MLDSTSTITEIFTEYQECASYDINNDMDKAGRFIIACRMLLRFPERGQHLGEEYQMNHASIKQELQEAQGFLSEGDGDSVLYYSFRNIRT